MPDQWLLTCATPCRIALGDRASQAGRGSEPQRRTESHEGVAGELVEPITEFLCGHAVPLELEEEHAGMWLELRFPVRRQHQLLEQLGI